MHISTLSAVCFLLPALPICVYIFYSDMKFKRISNLSVWALLIVFIIGGLLTLPFQEFLWRFANYAIVFAVLFVMWLARQMGAGDVKLAAVVALFIHPSDASPALFLAFSSVLAATLATLIVRSSPLRNLAPEWAAWGNAENSSANSVGIGNQFTLPMGTGIGLTLCIYLLLGALNGQ